MESTLLKRPYFAEEDDGLASIAEFSGNGNTRRYPVFSRLAGYSAASLNCSSPRSARRFEDGFHSPRSPHFLEACSLCKKPLGGNRDIFMYRGDVPFCSEECRGEQIQADEAMEKSLCLSASVKSMRKKKSTTAQQNASSSPEKSQKFRAGTVAAA